MTAIAVGFFLSSLALLWWAKREQDRACATLQDAGAKLQQANELAKDADVNVQQARVLYESTLDVSRQNVLLKAALLERGVTVVGSSMRMH